MAGTLKCLREANTMPEWVTQLSLFADFVGAATEEGANYSYVGEAPVTVLCDSSIAPLALASELRRLATLIETAGLVPEGVDDVTELWLQPHTACVLPGGCAYVEEDPCRE